MRSSHTREVIGQRLVEERCSLSNRGQLCGVALGAKPVAGSKSSKSDRSQNGWDFAVSKSAKRLSDRYVAVLRSKVLRGNNV